MERGLMKSFGKEGKSAILLKSSEGCEGGVVLEKALYKYRVFFRARHRKNNSYFAKFVLCESGMHETPSEPFLASKH